MRKSSVAARHRKVCFIKILSKVHCDLLLLLSQTRWSGCLLFLTPNASLDLSLLHHFHVTNIQENVPRAKFLSKQNIRSLFSRSWRVSSKAQNFPKVSKPLVRKLQTTWYLLSDCLRVVHSWIRYIAEQSNSMSRKPPVRTSSCCISTTLCSQNGIGASQFCQKRTVCLCTSL